MENYATLLNYSPLREEGLSFSGYSSVNLAGRPQCNAEPGATLRREVGQRPILGYPHRSSPGLSPILYKPTAY